MAYRSPIIVLLLIVSALTASVPTWSSAIIRSKTDMDIDLIVYNGLKESSLFKGRLAAKTTHEIDTSYLGLALLVFAGSESYPIIIEDTHFTLHITVPNIPPSFPDGSENDYFYKLLTGEDPRNVQYTFSQLMVHAKRLLESSHNIQTAEELTAKKIEFHTFVAEHYDSLKHSDMVR